MSIAIEMSPEEIAEIKELTRLEDDGEAISQAAREFIRIARLREIKAVSGKMELVSNCNEPEMPNSVLPRAIDPKTRETFVLLRVDDYKRLKDEEYDDSPWTREELQALAWNAGKRAGWEDMDEYDDLPEKA